MAVAEFEWEDVPEGWDDPEDWEEDDDIFLDELSKLENEEFLANFKRGVVGEVDFDYDFDRDDYPYGYGND